MRCGAVRFVWFSYYKTANHTTLCGAVRCGVVHFYLRCGAVMPFYGRFWCSFCDLMNTPTDDAADDDDADFNGEDDGDASLPSDDEMST